MHKAFKIGIILYILADLVFVFYLQYHNPIDGDIVPCALPSEPYRHVLGDPLGFDALFHKTRYAGPNRFSAHFTLFHYYRSLPFLFQWFTSPINSIYLASAFFIVLIKGLFIYFFSYYVSGRSGLFNKDFLLAAIIIAPLVQTGGYRWNMGVVDPALGGTFGYSYPNLLVLLFFLPFFLSAFHDRKINFSVPLLAGIMFLAAFNAFNGALAAPLLIIISSFILGSIWVRNLKQYQTDSIIKRALKSFVHIPRHYIVACLFAMGISFYSFFIGKYNIESHMHQIPLWERYMHLPKGLYDQFSVKGLGMLLVMVIVNAIILGRSVNDEKARKIMTLLGWIGLFSILYTCMLPLGGYREYRPNVIRRDSFSPVVTAMIGFYALSTIHILRTIALQYKHIFMAVVIIPLLHYAIVNTYDVPDNSCEKEALNLLVASKEKVTALDAQCTIMGWEKITDHKQSKDIAAMLKVWGVTNEEKYFYQK